LCLYGDAMRLPFIIALVLLVFKGAKAESISESLVAAALERTSHPVRYDGAYYAISYSGGDGHYRYSPET